MHTALHRADVEIGRDRLARLMRRFGLAGVRRGKSNRTVKALAIRVGLSLTLFILLMASYYFGMVPGKLS